MLILLQSSWCILARSLSCRCTYNRFDDLYGAGILDLLDLVNDSLIDSCTDYTRSKSRTGDLAHDAADDGMDGDLSAVTVIGEVMGKTEGFFVEDFSKFLLLFNLLLVKDAPSSFNEFAVSRLRAEMSCVGFL